MLDGVCCTYALLHIRVELWIFLFFCLVFNSYNWGILPVTVFCSFVWYLTPIIEVFCLLLFSVLLFGIQLLLLRYSACCCFLFFCLVFNSYYWGILPVTVFCSFVWYLTPIIEVFCLLLFSVLFIFINSLWLNSVLLRLECICRTNSSHRKFYCSHTWPDYTLRNICVTNDHVYHSFVELTIRSFSL